MKESSKREEKRERHIYIKYIYKYINLSSSGCLLSSRNNLLKSAEHLYNQTTPSHILIWSITNDPWCISLVRIGRSGLRRTCHSTSSSSSACFSWAIYATGTETLLSVRARISDGYQQKNGYPERYSAFCGYTKWSLSLSLCIALLYQFISSRLRHLLLLLLLLLFNLSFTVCYTYMCTDCGGVLHVVVDELVIFLIM